MNIIPLPLKIEHQPGEFLLTRKTRILTDAVNRWNAEYLHKLINPPSGYLLSVQANDLSSKNVIRLSLDPELESLGDEGYRLVVQPEEVLIKASSTTGIFYGVQTLRQLLPSEIEERHPISAIAWRIPCCFIEDKPRFAWRGFMLDEGRHFLGKKTVLQTLDMMALLKLNILHWHLTEDQGWRIEIKKYPKLTEIGSQHHQAGRTKIEQQQARLLQRGYYTQEEIREIVSIANKRHITIVPEIEMPGHCMAALAAYPELSCIGGPFEVGTHFGIFPDIYCAGKEEVFIFLQDVLNEILELFPSTYIHIGGDEAPKKRWRSCPNCQNRIRVEGLKDEHALQVYFTNRIATYLEAKGRQVMGWNEILQDGLEINAVVQFWLRGRRRLIKAIRTRKQAVVMSTYLDTYLDHSYSLMPLSRAYQFEPLPAELDRNLADSILGLEFPLWTEWVPNNSRLEYQVYPRLTALAETGWTQEDKKNYQEFMRRLNNFLGRLDRLGVRYASLKEAEPSRLQKWFGIFTIALPQTKIASIREPKG